MPIYASYTKPVVEKIEDGTYQAVLSQMIYLGHQRFSNGEREWWSSQILIGFELPSLTFQTKEGETLSKIKSETYFLSLNPSKNGQIGLREIIDTFRGNSDWTEEELEKFDISQYLEKHCEITIESIESKGKVYSKIMGISLPKEGIPELNSIRKSIFIESKDFENTELISSLPEWIKNKIYSSKEVIEKNTVKEENSNQEEYIINLDDIK